jgi:hypothetical protein
MHMRKLFVSIFLTAMAIAISVATVAAENIGPTP